MIQELTFQKFFRSMRKSWYWFILVPLLLISLTYLLSNYVIKPLYTSQTQILVSTKSQSNELQTSDNVRSSIQLSDTYSTTLNSSRTLQNVINRYDLNLSSTALAKKVTVSGNVNSLVFTVTVVDKNPKMVETVANGIATVAQKDFPSLFSGTKIIKLESASKAVKTSNLTRYMLAFAFGIGIGIGIGIAIIVALLRAHYDNFIRQKENLEEMGLVFLGDLPVFKGGRSK